MKLPDFSNNSIKKSLDFVKDKGLDGIVSRVRYKLTAPGLAYNGWYKEVHMAGTEELDRQRQQHFTYEPVISILVPMYRTPVRYIKEMLDSVANQTYAGWELCIVDGSEAGQESEAAQLVCQYAGQDSRIKYMALEENQGITGSLNMAFGASAGDYICVLNHDDRLTEDALYCIVSKMQWEFPDIIYTDEDKMSADGGRFSDPAFKPDFSIDLLRSYNYMGHLVVYRRSIVERLGGFRYDFEGVEDYDFCLRAVGQCVRQLENGALDTDRVKHIPRVLYHSRIKSKGVDNSAHKGEQRNELGRKALAAYLRNGVSYATAVLTDYPDVYKVKYETPGNPLLSIIVPGANSVESMKKCLLPLFERSRYSNFEIIVVDPYGNDDAMSGFYRQLEATRRNVSVINDASATTLVQLRNHGAARAKGEYMLFLNPNTEICEPAAVREMLGCCMRGEVGVVGGTLYLSDDTLYEQGIILTNGGAVDYPNRGLKKGYMGYLMNNCMNRNYSAVSPRCMMLRASVFDVAGGFSEKLNDEHAAADLCLRIRERGLQVVNAADAVWKYYPQYEPVLDIYDEGRSEGIFTERWSTFLESGDPFFNENILLGRKKI